jgi:hypothetical protein
MDWFERAKEILQFRPSIISSFQFTDFMAN